MFQFYKKGDMLLWVSVPIKCPQWNFSLLPSALQVFGRFVLSFFFFKLMNTIKHNYITIVLKVCNHHDLLDLVPPYFLHPF